MSDLIVEFKLEIEKYSKKPILIKDHAIKRILERNLSVDLIIRDINENKTLINVEKQDKNKYLVSYQKKRGPIYCYVVDLKENQIELVTGWKVINRIQKKVNKNVEKIKF